MTLMQRICAKQRCQPQRRQRSFLHAAQPGSSEQVNSCFTELPMRLRTILSSPSKHLADTLQTVGCMSCRANVCPRQIGLCAVWLAWAGVTDTARAHQRLCLGFIKVLPFLRQAVLQLLQCCIHLAQTCSIATALNMCCGC